jgi:hypothetical protein
MKRMGLSMVIALYGVIGVACSTSRPPEQPTRIARASPTATTVPTPNDYGVVLFSTTIDDLIAVRGRPISSHQAMDTHYGIVDVFVYADAQYVFAEDVEEHGIKAFRVVKVLR